MQKRSIRADTGLPTDSTVNEIHEADPSVSKPLRGQKSKMLLCVRKKPAPEIDPYGILNTTLTVILRIRLFRWSTKRIVTDPRIRMGGASLPAGSAAWSKTRPRVLIFPWTVIHLRRKHHSFIDIYNPPPGPVSSRQSSGMRGRRFLVCHVVPYTYSWCANRPAEQTSVEWEFPGVVESDESTPPWVPPQ